MKNSLRFARLTVVLVALLAGIDPAKGDGFDLNHYILRCTDLCAALGNPVVPGSIGSAAETAIGAPGAVATDANGNVYFATPGTVFKLDTGGNLSQIAGTGTSGFSGDGGPARDALLNNMPYDNYPEAIRDPFDFNPNVGGLAVDGAGNVYIADAYNNRVRKVDPTGVITTVVGDGDKGDFSDATAGSRPAFAPITWPQGVAVDAAGDLYVVSAYGTLAKVTPDGAVTWLAGANCGSGYLGPGLCAPEGIALDSSGNVYAADGYCRIRKVAVDGSTVTVAGDDSEPDGGFGFTCGYNRETGKATTTALAWPYGVAIDKSGSLFIADTFNHCVRKVDAAGNISTIAGRCGSPGGGGDGGAATGASLNLPYGVATDSAGNVYIADSANYRIRKVSPDGIITTVAGTGAPPPPSPSIDATYTGSWYDPAQSGQGLSIEVLPDNHILAYWFTFNPDGTQQAWLVGTGTYSGNTATFDSVEMPTGAQWIPNFDPLQVIANAWGSLTLTFMDGNHGRADFVSGLGYGTGFLSLTRLTAPSGQMTGAWSDPAQPGHGLVLESLPGDRLLAEWFAFDPTGTQQSWFLGVGSVSGNTATITAIDQPTGGRFIPNFDPSKIVHNPWGSLAFTFTDCDHGRVDFASTAPGYGSASMNLTRLTRPTGVVCP